jgi:hypothetical protein
MQRARQALILRTMLAVVLANYFAQIPYYLDVYYLPHGAPPRLAGTLALLFTLVWFVAGYVWLGRGSRVGYWVLLAFIATEFSFYLWNTGIQALNGFPAGFHLQARDPVLFGVFAIGYLNFLAGAYFIYFLLRNRQSLIAARSQPKPQVLPVG